VDCRRVTITSCDASKLVNGDRQRSVPHQQPTFGTSSIVQSRTLPAGYVFRAKLILMLTEGASFNTIKRMLQTSAPTIIRWKQRFLEFGLDTYHPGQKATVLTPALRPRILSATRKKPSDGSTHWSCRKRRPRWASARTLCIGSGRKPVSNPIAWSVTWPATIRSSKTKRPTFSACICGLRSSFAGCSTFGHLQFLGYLKSDPRGTSAIDQYSYRSLGGGSPCRTSLSGFVFRDTIRSRLVLCGNLTSPSDSSCIG
jgi:transposase-like protein